VLVSGQSRFSLNVERPRLRSLSPISRPYNALGAVPGQRIAYSTVAAICLRLVAEEGQA